MTNDITNNIINSFIFQDKKYLVDIYKYVKK